jgi:hypothetical protein
VSDPGGPFSQRTRRQLEGEYYAHIARFARHVADLRASIERIGGLPPDRLAALLRDQLTDHIAADVIATLAWPLLQGHARLLDGLDAALRLAELRPDLLTATSRENIELLQDSGLLDEAVTNALAELNRLRNWLVHDFLTITANEVMRALRLTLMLAGRYRDTLRPLLDRAGLQQ